MANRLNHKRSAVPGKVPQLTDLQLGELAINTHDGRIYFKKNDGTESLVSIGGDGQSSFHRFEHTAAAGQTQFSAAYMPGSLIVIHNGRVLQPSDFIATTMTSVTVPTAREGDSILILSFSTFEVANTYSKGEVDDLVYAVTSGFRNRLINANFAINQRVYTSGAATTAANQYTLDRWRVVVAGQTLPYTTAGNGRQVTAPAGGLEQVIEGAAIEGGIYTLSWIGTATATINGTAVANGGQTANLAPGANVTVRFRSGTVREAQLEPGWRRTPFEYRPPAVEEPMCMRFFCKSYRNAVKPGTPTEDGMLLFHSSGSTSFAMPIMFPVSMRAVPTVTFYSPLTGAVGKRHHASGLSDAGDQGIQVFGTAISERYVTPIASAITLDGWNERIHYTAEAEL